MLAVGRALMAKPKLLMLDEPSLGLAPLIVREIFHIIVELKRRGVSILLVEQNARAALQIADYAYVLETGECVLDGPAAHAGERPARDRELPRAGAEGLRSSPCRAMRAADHQYNRTATSKCQVRRISITS